MIQIVKKAFKSIDEAVLFINQTAIEYEYLVDYQVLVDEKNETTEDEVLKKREFIVLLKFDIHKEVDQFLELARLKLKRDENGVAYLPNATYKIEIDDTKSMRSIFLNLEFNTVEKRYIEIFIHLDLKVFFRSVEILNKEYEGYQVKLVIPDDAGYWKEKEITIVKNIDLNKIYEHLIDSLLFCGYLFDKESLKMLKNNINNIVRDFERKCKEKS